MSRLGKMADEPQTKDKNVKHYLSLVTFTAAALLVCAAQLWAQDRLTKAADNRVYAQALLNDVVKSNRRARCTEPNHDRELTRSDRGEG